MSLSWHTVRLIGCECQTLALKIIEMAPATYCVTYKAGTNSGSEGERKVVRRANNPTHRGICVSYHRRDESANRRVHRESD